jgi:hypothetical protein
MPAFSASDLQVLDSSLRPFCWISHRRLLKVQYSDTGADQGADRFVKGDQHRWRAIAGAPAIMMK